MDKPTKTYFYEGREDPEKYATRMKALGYDAQVTVTIRVPLDQVRLFEAAFGKVMGT